MKLETKALPFECKSVEESEDGAICTFSGLGAVCVNIDGWGDIIDTGAFDQDFKFMLAEGKVRDEHGVTTGRIVDGEILPAALRVKGEIYGTSAGKDQRILMKTKTVSRLSIGYSALKREWLEGEDEVKAYWQSKGYTPTEDDLIALGCYGCVRLLKRVKVYEVSTTWCPANERARVEEVKSGPRAGRTLTDHTAQVLASVGDLIDRAGKVQTLREAKSRTIGPEQKARLTQLKSRLSTLLTALEAKGQAPTPATKTNAAALFQKFRAVSAGLDD